MNQLIFDYLIIVLIVFSIIINKFSDCLVRIFFYNLNVRRIILFSGKFSAMISIYEIITKKNFIIYKIGNYKNQKNYH